MATLAAPVMPAYADTVQSEYATRQSSIPQVSMPHSVPRYSDVRTRSEVQHALLDASREYTTASDVKMCYDSILHTTRHDHAAEAVAHADTVQALQEDAATDRQRQERLLVNVHQGFSARVKALEAELAARDATIVSLRDMVTAAERPSELPCERNPHTYHTAAKHVAGGYEYRGSSSDSRAYVAAGAVDLRAPPTERATDRLGHVFLPRPTFKVAAGTPKNEVAPIVASGSANDGALVKKRGGAARPHMTHGPAARAELAKHCRHSNDLAGTQSVGEYWLCFDSVAHSPHLFLSRDKHAAKLCESCSETALKEWRGSFQRSRRLKTGKGGGAELDNELHTLRSLANHNFGESAALMDQRRIIDKLRQELERSEREHRVLAGKLAASAKQIHSSDVEAAEAAGVAVELEAKAIDQARKASEASAQTEALRAEIRRLRIELTMEKAARRNERPVLATEDWRPVPKASATTDVAATARARAAEEKVVALTRDMDALSRQLVESQHNIRTLEAVLARRDAEMSAAMPVDDVAESGWSAMQ